MKFQEDLPNKEGSNERSGTRTPMQWTKGKNAGFSTCAPENLYFPIATDGGKLTVEAQDRERNSLLNYTRSIIKLRHSTPALNNNGSWRMLSSTDKPYPMAYERTDGNERYVVVLNPSAKPATAQIAALGGKAEVVSAVGKAS